MNGEILTSIFKSGATFYNDVTLQGRIVMNTYLAICASCAAAFPTSVLWHRGKMEMVRVINSLLMAEIYTLTNMMYIT